MMEYSPEDKDRRVTQLRKGILELAIMGVLDGERHYGYSLIRALSSRSSLSLKEGTVYPILSRLDRDGVVRSQWVESSQGPPRKYYELTPAGRTLLHELREEFLSLVSLVQSQSTPKEEAHEPLSRIRIQSR